MVIIEGKPEMRYINGYREYLIDDNWYPSVTSVLSALPKPALEKWKKSLTKEEQRYIQNRTANIGELIHYYCLQQWANNYNERTGEYIHQDLPDFISSPNNNIVTLVEKYQKNIELGKVLFDQFLKVYSHRIKILDIETGVYHKNPDYAGRYDIKGQIYERGKWYNMLADIKTSKRVYKDSVGLQLTAYNQAENNWADRLYVLRIHPYFEEDHKPDWEFTRVDQDWDKFKEVYGMFEEEKGLNRIKNEDDYKTSLFKKRGNRKPLVKLPDW